MLIINIVNKWKGTAAWNFETKNKFDTNRIGSISESAITTRFLQLGYYVYSPMAAMNEPIC